MSLVKYSVEGAVALIALNRPPVNALSGELITAIDDALISATGDDVRAVVITGEPHFAAGADITGFQAAFDSGTEDQMAGDLAAVVRRLEQLQKPTIAAVRGFALGGGLELAMGADFRYLAEDAKVGQPEIFLGIIPGAGGTQRLQRIVGYQKAKNLNMSGEHIGAEEAVGIGLADKVVASDDLVSTAMTDAAKWAKGPTKAYAAVKQAMTEGHGRPIDDAMAAEVRAFQDVFTTDDARIGVAAFLNKEKPDFTGS